MALPVMLGPALDFCPVDKRRSPRAGITDTVSFVDYTDFITPLALDAALTTLLPAVYTVAVLNKMCTNDKQYAVMRLQENAGI